MSALTQTQAVTVARTVAAANGITLEADALDAVATRLTADLGLDDNQSLAFEIATPFTVERGQVIDAMPLAHALSIVREHGRPADPAPSTTPSSTSTWSVQRPDASARRGPAYAAAEDARLLNMAQASGNPWQAGQLNRTHQTVISRLRPDLAQKYRKEARLQ